MGSTLLQVFLIVNVFLVGVLSAIAFRHAYAHFRPAKPVAPKPKAVVQGLHLPREVKEQVLAAGLVKFQTILDHSAEELQNDMKSTTIQLNKQLEKLGTEIVASEMQRYKDSLDELRAQAETTLSGAQSEVDKHQAELEAKFAERRAELEAKLTEEMSDEKQRLLAAIDTKLSDAVASFLIETLQHNVDLGAQTAYLTSVLEEHKADFRREVADEIPTA